MPDYFYPRHSGDVAVSEICRGCWPAVGRLVRVLSVSLRAHHHHHRAQHKKPTRDFVSFRRKRERERGSWRALTGAARRARDRQPHRPTKKALAAPFPIGRSFFNIFVFLKKSATLSFRSAHSARPALRCRPVGVGVLSSRFFTRCPSLSLPSCDHAPVAVVVGGRLFRIRPSRRQRRLSHSFVPFFFSPKAHHRPRRDPTAATGQRRRRQQH
jgi:hypothetical protein